MTRLLDLGVPAYLINSTLLGVMAQRLVRTLCPHCKKPVQMREEQRAAWRALVAPWKSAEPTQIWQPVGCLECRKKLGEAKWIESVRGVGFRLGNPAEDAASDAATS